MSLKVAEKPSREYSEYHYGLIREATMKIVNARHDATKAFGNPTPKLQMLIHKKDITKGVFEKIKKVCRRNQYPYNVVNGVKHAFDEFSCNKNGVSMPGSCCPRIHTIFRRIEELANRKDFLMFAFPKEERRGLFKLIPMVFEAAQKES